MPHDVTSVHCAGHLHPTKKLFRYELQHYAQLSFTQMLCPACGLECKCGATEVVLMNTTKIEHCNSVFCHNFFFFNYYCSATYFQISDVFYAQTQAHYFRCSNLCHVRPSPGVCHGDDLFYLFPAGPILMPPADGPQDLQRPDDLAVRDIISKLWTNFATTGYGNCMKSLASSGEEIPQNDYVNATGRNRFISILIQMLLYSQISKKIYFIHFVAVVMVQTLTKS